MKPCSYKLLILPLLLFLWVQPIAFAQDKKNEERDYTLAKRAFQDELYPEATVKLANFISQYPTSTNKPEARLLLGQALYFQQKYTEALEQFQINPPENSPATLTDSLLFWQAETLAALEKHPEAEATYRTCINNSPQDTVLHNARLGLATTLVHQNKTDEPLNILRELQLLGPKDPVSQRASLLRGKILLQLGQSQDASTQFTQLLEQKPPPPILFDTLYWLAEIARLDKKNPDALKLYNRITSDARATPRETVALSWFGIGEIHRNDKNWNAATEAYSQAMRTSKKPETIQISIQRLLAAHTSAGTLSSAALSLKQFIQQNGENYAVGLYLLAEAFRKAENLDAAISELYYLISQYPNSTWAAEARFLIGEIFHQKGDANAAIDAFEAIRNATPPPPRLREALFRLAEIHFKAQRYSESAAIYTQIATLESNDPGMEKALFNAVLAFSGAGRIEEFNTASAAFFSRFPKSELGGSIQIEKARLLSQTGKREESRAQLKEFLASSRDANLLPQALFMLGALSYQDVLYQEAAEAFRKLETEFPTSDLFRKAKYHRILAELRSDKISHATAREQLQGMETSTAPADEISPNISLQIAQTYYEEQNFAQAQEAFHAFTEKHPNHPMKDQALFFQGRSMVWLDDLVPAINTFESIDEKSPVKREARLVEIDCYRKLGNFAAAAKIADALISLPTKEDATHAEALLRKAGLSYTMAEAGTSNYQEALDYAQKVLDSPAATITQRNEAGFIKGKSLEKLNQHQEALQSYLDVIYAKLIPATPSSSPPEYRWFTRCGVEAALIKESQNDIRGAIAIYQILERLSGPNREEFTRKIEDLRAKHFIWK